MVPDTINHLTIGEMVPDTVNYLTIGDSLFTYLVQHVSITVTVTATFISIEALEKRLRDCYQKKSKIYHFCCFRYPPLLLYMILTEWFMKNSLISILSYLGRVFVLSE